MKTGRPSTISSNGLVATPHYLASQAGLKVLRDGGNAVDAAIAANAVLTVVMPDSCSIGGDLFAVIWDSSSQQISALNGSGRAGQHYSADAIRSAGLNRMAERGPLSVTVPGTVEAWQTLLDRHGSIELGRLLEDATAYAGEGYPVTPRMQMAITAAFQLLGQNAAAARQFLEDGEIPRIGATIKQPALAASLRAIGREGVKAFYSGTIAERIIRDVERLGGWLTVEDLEAQHSQWVEPLRTTYRDFEVLEMPPNTQGITALQMLNIVEGWNVERMGLNSADQIHHFVEAKKLAFADRDRYVGDPAFVDVPIARLNSKEYAAELRARIDPERALFDLRDRPGAGGTVYLCVFDQQGLGISLIQSIFRGFGSGIVAEGTGIVLHNRGASFVLDDGAANQIEPGKRPMHTLIPGMLLRDGRLWSLFGTQGGHGQAQTHLQLVTRLIDHRMHPQAAIESARWTAGRALAAEPEHVLKVEENVGTEILDELRARGHEVQATEQWWTNMGHAQAIVVDWQNGVLLGGADPRADGAALGW